MTHVYPIYLVIDASDSMNDLLRGKNDSLENSADVDDSDLPSEESSEEETLIEYASNIPRAFYEEYENNPSLEKQLLVGVIAFNAAAAGPLKAVHLRDGAAVVHGNAGAIGGA